VDFDLGMGSLEYKQNSGFSFFLKRYFCSLKERVTGAQGVEDDGELESTLGTSMCRVGGGWLGQDLLESVAVLCWLELLSAGLSFDLHGWVCGFLARIIVIAHSSCC
jgi:hypothetical protein